MDCKDKDNNVILTQTEGLTMGKPSSPKYARNKNILVIGGSGSGKTRFFVKPNLMQMHSSYIVTDPKGTVLIECGKMLERGRPVRDEKGNVSYIPNVTQPADKGILLRDVLENGVFWQEKSYCVTASYQGAAFHNTMERKQRTMVAVPVATVNGKSHTIPATYYKAGTDLFPVYRAENSRQKIAVPIRIGQIGKGGQGQRIYSVRGKSVTMTANGGGMGAKTGLYKIDLPDGDYIIRKLTPIEAERLQTLPDNYTAGISNTQRYKCIGNGWTVDVIAHILGGLKNVEGV